MTTFEVELDGVTTFEVELDNENRFHDASREYHLTSGALWIEGKWEHGFRHGTWRGLDGDGEVATEVTFERVVEMDKSVGA